MGGTALDAGPAAVRHCPALRTQLDAERAHKHTWLFPGARRPSSRSRTTDEIRALFIYPFFSF